MSMTAGARALFALSAVLAVGLVVLWRQGPPRVEAALAPASEASGAPASEGDVDGVEAASNQHAGSAGATAAEPPPPAASATDAARVRRAFTAAMAGEAAPHQAVVHLDALRTGDLGAGIRACYKNFVGLAGPETDPVAHLGFDPLDAVDRVGVNGELVALTGRFGTGRFETLTSQKPRPYGQRGRLFGGENGASGEVLGTWGDDLVLVGRDAATVQAALDRIEGRAPAGPAAAVASGGEIRGVTTADEALEPFLTNSDARGDLRDALRAADIRADFNVAVVDGGLQIGLRVHAAPPGAPRASESAAPGTGPESAEPPVDPAEALDAAANILEAQVAALREPPADQPNYLPELAQAAFKSLRMHRDGSDITLDMDVPKEAVQQLLAMCQMPVAAAAPAAVLED